ncbi:MAG TPA: alpha/beta hydrolase [Chthonomonadaceae bacterium]|nr:alpha/beta hydrolase [Chthonomonadaceae bacterium]
MKLEVVAIPEGEARLAGLRYVPEAPAKPVALLYAHGFTAGKYSLDGLASYLTGRGYEGLTFDFIGHKLGCSGGEMRHLDQATGNLAAALAWMRRATRAAQIVLIGHSMGAAAALQVASQESAASSHALAPVAGLISMCVGKEPTKGFGQRIGAVMLAQRGDYVAGAPPEELLAEMDRLVLAAAKLGDLPALFIAARQDVIVPVSGVEALAALAGANATFAIVDSAHLDAPDRSRATIIRWLEETL